MFLPSKTAWIYKTNTLVCVTRFLSNNKPNLLQMRDRSILRSGSSATLNLSYLKFSWGTTLSSFSQNVDERVKFYIEREWWNVFRVAMKTTSSPVENKHFQVYFSHRLKLLNFFSYSVWKHVASYCTKTAGIEDVEITKQYWYFCLLILF